MAQANKIEVVKFSKVIPAGTVGMVLRERIKADGTIVEVSGKFYSGQVLGLQVTPKVMKAHDLYMDLYTYPEGSRNYICGDDQEFSDPMSLEVTNDEELYLIVGNTNAFDCNLSISITIDYYAGKNRVVA